MKPSRIPTAEAAGRVNRAALENFKLDRAIDELRTYQRENASLSVQYRKADEYNRLLAQWNALRLLGQAFHCDFDEVMDTAAHDLRVYHDYDPEEGTAWSDVPVPLLVRSVALVTGAGL